MSVSTIYDERDGRRRMASQMSEGEDRFLVG